MQGIVTSDATPKTVAVKVTFLKEHRKYKKHFKVEKKYQAHDEEDKYHPGDVVEIQETRPISKMKKWKVVRKIK